jgi:hypothetical protein
VATCCILQSVGQTHHSITRGSERTREYEYCRKLPSRVLNSARYSLPCSVGALFGLFALIIGYSHLEETSKHDRYRESMHKPASAPNSLSSTTPTGVEDNSRLVGIWTILAHPPLRHVLLTGFGASFLATAYEVVFALVSYSPIHLGGLSRSVSEVAILSRIFSQSTVQPAEIGYGFALSGIISIIILPTGTPFLQHRHGTIPLYQFVVSLWPIVFLGFPLLNLLARRFIVEGSPTGSMDGGVALLWAGMAILIFTSRIASMSFG